LPKTRSGKIMRRILHAGEQIILGDRLVEHVVEAMLKQRDMHLGAEIGGDGALKVDPRSSTDIAAALRTLCLDEAGFETYRKAGLARAKDFTWRRSAEGTLEVYRDLLNKGEA
ncbi:MAG: hypothetical protein ACNA8W_06450, partial [Bradymonadaceae bacterium]